MNSGPGYSSVVVDQTGNAQLVEHEPMDYSTENVQITNYLFNTMIKSDFAEFSDTLTETQKTLGELGISYDNVSGPDSDNPDDLYPALIRRLLFLHGEPELEYIGAENEYAVAYRYKGLCCADLYDFDKDGKNELIAAYRKDSDYSSFYVDLFTVVNGQPVLAWSGDVMSSSWDSFFIFEDDGIAYLHDTHPASKTTFQFRAVTIDQGKAVVYGEDSSLAQINTFSTDYAYYFNTSRYILQKDPSMFRFTLDRMDETLQKYGIDPSTVESLISTINNLSTQTGSERTAPTLERSFKVQGIETKLMYAASDKLNIREGPGSEQYDAFAVLHLDDPVYVLGYIIEDEGTPVDIQDTWYLVINDSISKVGCVKASYLSDAADASPDIDNSVSNFQLSGEPYDISLYRASSGELFKTAEADEGTMYCYYDDVNVDIDPGTDGNGAIGLLNTGDAVSATGYVLSFGDEGFYGKDTLCQIEYEGQKGYVYEECLAPTPPNQNGTD